jgi:cellulose biosynthesis protein BcsQ
MKTIAFFNNKGGVGKTSLVYHLSWMYMELGLKVVVADLDPQANLTAMFLSEEKLDELWEKDENDILSCIIPILKGTGDIAISPLPLQLIAKNISVVAGNLGLSIFEDRLSEKWSKCMDGDNSAFRTISAFYRILLAASEQQNADIVLIDVGPNLGAINRSALISADYIVIPLAPDLFSLQGLKNLGPSLRNWRTGWKKRLSENTEPDLPLPSGKMQPAGYVILQHGERETRPVKAYSRWMQRMPGIYRQHVLDEQKTFSVSVAVNEDEYCLATLKNYRSLMPMAMEAHKPMFYLKPADGAIGAHTQAVTRCFADFKQLAQKIADVCDISLVS